MGKPEYYSGKDEYKKANLLIGSKYRSSLLENKLLAVSISKLNEAKEDKGGTLIVQITASELKQTLGVSSNSFYERLSEAAETMTGRTIGMSDPEAQTFEYIAVVDRAYYESGVLTVEYNRHLNKYLKDIDANFTLLSLGTMMTFNSVYSFRLYEVLKSRCFTPKGVPKTNKYEIKMSLSELKLDLGIINANEDRVKRILRGSPTPDFDEAARVAVEKTYPLYYDFKRVVLSTAVSEINTNEKAKMHIEYEPIRAGKGGKVHGIIFYVDILNTLSLPNSTALTEDEEMEFLFDLKGELIDFPSLKVADIRNIAEASCWDMQKCKKAVAIAKASPDVVYPAKFIISAIKNEWEPSASPDKKKKGKYLQQTYDFDEIESTLLSNQ